MTTQDAILSSGTLATLTGITDCNALDRIQAEFLEWIEKAGQKFANWQEAWNAFCRPVSLDPIISQLKNARSTSCRSAITIPAFTMDAG